MLSLGDLPDYSALAEFRALERDLLEFKAAQRVGSDSLLIKYSKTAAPWDVDEVVSSALTFVRWRVIFTPDHGGVPHAELGFDHQRIPDDPFSIFEVYPDPAYIAGSGVAFLIAFTNNSFADITVRLKFGIKSIDSGMLSVARVFQS